MPKNPVVHFEMAAEDPQRMMSFYEQAFGWKTQQLGPEMGNYVVAETCEMGEDGWPKKPGRINGGFYKKMDDPKMNTPSVVIAVPDIHAHIKKVEAAGGTMLNGPTDIPGIGTYASFTDTEGNRVSMLQPIKADRAN
jgi:predicted enzyme related to lactoylglutathione lyase